MLFLFDSFWFMGLLLLPEPYHYIRFEKEYRYYELRLSKDLLGDWTLILSNGRIKTKLGKSRTQAFYQFDDALIQLYALVKIRLQRNYHLVSSAIESFMFLLVLNLIVADYIFKQNIKVKKKAPPLVRPSNHQIKQISKNLNQFSLLFQE